MIPDIYDIFGVSKGQINQDTKFDLAAVYVTASSPYFIWANLYVATHPILTLGKTNQIVMLEKKDTTVCCLVWSELPSVIWSYEHSILRLYDDVITWKRLAFYWPFVSRNQQSPMDYGHVRTVCVSLIFSLVSTWTKCWTNNGVAGDLSRSCGIAGKAFLWSSSVTMCLDNILQALSVPIRWDGQHVPKMAKNQWEPVWDKFNSLLKLPYRIHWNLKNQQLVTKAM